VDFAPAESFNAKVKHEPAGASSIARMAHLTPEASEGVIRAGRAK
jgi:hypothetical protein